MVPPHLKTADDYRAEAERVREEALRVFDRELRRQFLEIAESYDKLAEVARFFDSLPVRRRPAPRPLA
jgi:hypothetical protein